MLFKYNDTYLANGFNLSPIRLSFDNSIQTGPPSPFNGLFGVFSDSIPDAWGRLLIKRKLAAQQIAIESLNSLDYLMFVGSNGPGSLKYRPTVAEDFPEQKTIDLDALNEGAGGAGAGEDAEMGDGEEAPDALDTLNDLVDGEAMEEDGMANGVEGAHSMANGHAADAVQPKAAGLKPLDNFEPESADAPKAMEE